jgi:hypothetical protein
MYLYYQRRREEVRAGGGYFQKWEKGMVQLNSAPKQTNAGGHNVNFFSLIQNVQKFYHFQTEFYTKLKL